MATHTLQRDELRLVAHTRGLGHCPACGVSRDRLLKQCERCGQHTLHKVCTWSEFTEEVCENPRCNALESSPAVVQFSAEMKEALYQLERGE